MPEVDRSQFGIHPRIDGNEGYRTITPTTMKFVEEDGSDIRMSRVRIYDMNGVLIRSYMLSPMGQRYKDMETYPDDPSYLESI